MLATSIHKGPTDNARAHGRHMEPYNNNKKTSSELYTCLPYCTGVLDGEKVGGNVRDSFAGARHDPDGAMARGALERGGEHHGKDSAKRGAARRRIRVRRARRRRLHGDRRGRRAQRRRRRDGRVDGGIEKDLVILTRHNQRLRVRQEVDAFGLVALGHVEHREHGAGRGVELDDLLLLLRQNKERLADRIEGHTGNVEDRAAGDIEVKFVEEDGEDPGGDIEDPDAVRVGLLTSENAVRCRVARHALEARVRAAEERELLRGHGVPHAVLAIDKNVCAARARRRRRGGHFAGEERPRRRLRGDD
mmetsp:Transcript_41627/g.75301  ORF Transcript_41627/g.75301 Transcript_41627/m.75301 type:complete len:305 (-) Transcript_41627:489-1403(-)